MRVWCKHIELHPLRKHAQLKHSDQTRWVLMRHGYVYKSWKMCPICGALRPTKRNVDAAVNRELQDGKQ